MALKGDIMVNYKRYFKDEYKLALKEVSYRLIHNEVADFSISVLDNATVEKTSKGIDVCYHRKVSFVPESLYSIDVSFLISLTFNENVSHELSDDIDWEKEFSNSDNSYFPTICGRISTIIANITSSYGAPPLITPIGFVSKG